MLSGGFWEDMSQVLISLSCKPDEKKGVGGQKPRGPGPRGMGNYLGNDFGHVVRF